MGRDATGTRAGLLAMLAALSLVATIACGSSTKPLTSLFVEELQVDVTVSPQLNQGYPVAVDLLVLYDDALLQQVLEMSAEDWFTTKRDEFRRDFPDKYQSWEWEWVPGQDVPSQRLRFHARRSKGAVLFASYQPPGPHRARIDLHKPVMLVLDAETFSLRGR